MNNIKIKKRGFIKNQNGYLMPFTLVIILGLAAFSIAINSLVSRSSSNALLQGLSTQAYFAAQSGAQYAMHILYFNQSTRSQVDAQCVSVNGNAVSFSAAGLSQCSANISCQRNVNTADTVSTYEVSVSGECGSGDVIAQRDILVKGRME